MFIPPHTDSKSSRKGFDSLQKWKMIKPTINWYKSALPVPLPTVAASAQRADHPLTGKAQMWASPEAAWEVGKTQREQESKPASMGGCQQPGTCRESSLEVHREEAGRWKRAPVYPWDPIKPQHRPLAAKLLQWLLREHQPTPASEQLGPSSLSLRQTGTWAFLNQCPGFSSRVYKPIPACLAGLALPQPRKTATHWGMDP